ncbi:MAG TPA: cytochrome C [Aestuariivirgaceae bacterium]|nr:cytochrome C [Aestuariivirgaceae bacterium]
MTPLSWPAWCRPSTSYLSLDSKDVDARPKGGHDGARFGFTALWMIFAFATIATAFAQPVAERLPQCLACHGENGQSQMPDIPSLGGQPEEALTIQLFVFREKLRPNNVMNEFAKDLTDSELVELAKIIAKLPPPKPPAEPPNQAQIERGRVLASQHRCGFCHNPDFSGREQMLRLAAQREDYLAKTMLDYKSGARPGYDSAMAQVLAVLNEGDIRDLAHYLAHFR